MATFSKSNIENLRNELNRNELLASDSGLIVSDTGCGKVISTPLNLKGQSNTQTPNLFDCKSGPAIRYKHQDELGHEYPSLYIYMGRYATESGGSVNIKNIWINEDSNPKDFFIIDARNYVSLSEKPIKTTYRADNRPVDLTFNIVAQSLADASINQFFGETVDGWIELPIASIEANPLVAACFVGLGKKICVAFCVCEPDAENGYDPYKISNTISRLYNLNADAFDGMVGKAVPMYSVKPAEKTTIQDPAEEFALSSFIENANKNYILFKENDELEFSDEGTTDPYTFLPIFDGVFYEEDYPHFMYGFAMPFWTTDAPINEDYESTPQRIAELSAQLVTESEFNGHKIWTINGLDVQGGQNKIILTVPTDPEALADLNISNFEYKFLKTPKGGCMALYISPDIAAIRNYDSKNIILKFRPKVLINSYTEETFATPTIVAWEPVIVFNDNIDLALQNVPNGVLGTREHIAAVIFGDGKDNTFNFPIEGVGTLRTVQKSGYSWRRVYACLCPPYWSKNLANELVMMPFADTFLEIESTGGGAQLEDYYSTPYASIASYEQAPPNPAHLSGVPNSKQFAYRLYGFQYPPYIVDYIPQKKDPSGMERFKESNFDWIIRRRDKAISADLEPGAAQLSDTADSWRVEYVRGFIPDSTGFGSDGEHRSMQITYDLSGFPSGDPDLSQLRSFNALQPYNWMARLPDKQVTIQPFGIDPESENFYTRYSDAWQNEPLDAAHGEILTRVTYADGRTKLEYADLDWSQFWWGLSNMVGNISAQTSAMSGDYGDLKDDVYALQNLSARYWWLGGNETSCYGDAIGNYNSQKVIDLNDRVLVAPYEEYWTVGSNLSVIGKQRIEGGDGFGTVLDVNGQIYSSQDIYANSGFGNNSNLHTSQHIYCSDLELDTHVLATNDGLGNAMTNLNVLAQQADRNSSQAIGATEMLSNDLTTVKDQISSIQSVNESLSTDIDDIRTALSGDPGSGGSGSVYDQISSVNNRVDAADVQIQSITDDLTGFHAQYDTDVSNLSNELTSVNGTVYTIQNELTSINGSITQIQSELTSVNNKIYSLSSNLSSVPDQIYNLSSNLSSVPDQMYRLSSDLSSIPNQFYTLSSELSSIPDKVFDLSSELSSVPNTINELTSEVGNLLDGQSELSSDLSTAQEGIAALGLAYIGLESSLQSKADLSSLSNYVEKQTSEVQTISTPLLNLQPLSCFELNAAFGTDAGGIVKPYGTVTLNNSSGDKTTLYPARTVTERVGGRPRQVYHNPEIASYQASTSATYTLKVPYENGTIATKENLNAEISAKADLSALSDYLSAETDPIFNDWLSADNVAAGKDSGVSAIAAYDSAVEWLQTDGTAYIDTGIVGTNSLKVEISFDEDTSTTMDGIALPFGARTSTTSNIFGLRYAGQNNSSTPGKFSLDYNTQTGKIAQNQNTTRPILVKAGKAMPTYSNVLLITNGEQWVTPVADFENGLNNYLFACNSNGTAVVRGTDATVLSRIYYCKIWNNTVLVRDFIPVRKNGVGYMFDRVSKTLFGNVAGSGAFTYGSDAEEQNLTTAVAIGKDAVATENALQLGNGTNDAPKSFYIGNALLLDQNGKIQKESIDPDFLQNLNLRFTIVNANFQNIETAIGGGWKETANLTVGSLATGFSFSTDGSTWNNKVRFFHWGQMGFIVGSVRRSSALAAGTTYGSIGKISVPSGFSFMAAGGSNGDQRTTMAIAASGAVSICPVTAIAANTAISMRGFIPVGTINDKYEKRYATTF